MIFVREYCSQCHAIGKADGSHLANAAPFRALRLRYSVADLQRPLLEGIHPAMPRFQLTSRTFPCWRPEGEIPMSDMKRREFITLLSAAFSTASRLSQLPTSPSRTTLLRSCTVTPIALISISACRLQLACSLTRHGSRDRDPCGLGQSASEPSDNGGRVGWPRLRCDRNADKAKHAVSPLWWGHGHGVCTRHPKTCFSISCTGCFVRSLLISAMMRSFTSARKA